jgi:Acetyltransferase (GNAT) domain
MALTIVRARLDSDRDLLIETVRRLLNPDFNAARFDWLYSNNPHGAARGWLAIDSARVVGMAAAFPRWFYVDGSEVCCWVLGDFCLDSKYRSLGPALQLQRACLHVVEENQPTLCYDFPSAPMAAIYRRLGFDMTGKLLRLALPLRIDRKVKEKIRNCAAQRLLSSLGNAVLKARLPKGPVGDALEMVAQSGACGKEFTALADAQSGKLGIFLSRSADYLNWRYVNNPLADYQIITARRQGRLKGYAVWREEGPDASVVDLFGEDNPAIIKALLAGVVGHVRDRGVATLSLWLSDSHPWLWSCQEFGFQPRDAVPMVCVPGTVLANSEKVRHANWFLMQGDRDS